MILNWTTVALECLLRLLLSSPAFSHGGLIPAAYICDASSLSPPLVWSDIPEDAKCLALFCYDPDAPGRTFCHWAIYNIGSGASGLEEGAGARTRKATYPQAVNDFCCAGYDGPCPPRGHGIHHYHFRLSALKEPLDDVATRARCAEVMPLARHREIASVELIGSYERY